MPGILTYRTLASASRGGRATGGHATLWPKPGKKQDDNFPAPLQLQQAKGGMVFPLNMFPSVKPSETQAKQRKGMDSFPHNYMIQAIQSKMYIGDALNADRSYLNSGSAQDPSLAKMVHNFMEGAELSQLCKCGRVRCNCDMRIGNVVDAPHSDRSIDRYKRGHERELSKILKGFTSAMDTLENALFVDVIKAMAYSKEQESELGSENIEFTSGRFKRAVMKQLIAAGYKAAICTSRWEQATAGGFPGGEYEYMDVIDFSNCSSERLIIDIQFRVQFEIARPTDDYNAVFQELPSVFVGKADKLLQIVNAMSEAITKSLTKNGMPIPPWRKLEYIKAKWFSSYKRCSKIVEQHLNNILRQDLGWDSNSTTSNELQYNNTEADLQDLTVNDLDVYAKYPLRTSASVLEAVPKRATNSLYNGNQKTVMRTDWQPPPVCCKLSRKAGCKVAGLTSALMAARLTTLSKKQNAENLPLTVDRAITTALVLQ